MVRTGKWGEYEKKFLSDKKIYLTWDKLQYDLSTLKDKSKLLELIQKYFPDIKQKTSINWMSQIWPFVKKMKKGDWVAVPSKANPVIHIAEIVGDYKYNPKADDPFYHTRDIKWIETNIPRSNFGQDLLYSIGAYMTVCQIKRNDAETRVRNMAKNGWKDVTIGKPVVGAEDEDEESITSDLEEIANDQIAKELIKKYKGHGMAKLVEAILKAQGFQTHLSPEGVDHGVDIFAAPGSLGFGHPRICVQVKSQESPIERTVVDQLIGNMQTYNADQGLLVSWGGFKNSMDKEIPKQFFRVRLWNQKTLIEQLLSVYDKLDDEIKAELPFKRIWTMTTQEEE